MGSSNQQGQSPGQVAPAIEPSNWADKYGAPVINQQPISSAVAPTSNWADKYGIPVAPTPQPDNPTPALPGVTGDNKLGRYTGAIPTGMAKGAAGILDQLGNAGQNEYNLDATDPFGVIPGHDLGSAKPATDTPVSDYANANLPDPKDQVEAALQGAGRGATENFMFGPAGMAQG